MTSKLGTGGGAGFRKTNNQERISPAGQTANMMVSRSGGEQRAERRPWGTRSPCKVLGLHAQASLSGCFSAPDPAPAAPVCTLGGLPPGTWGWESHPNACGRSTSQASESEPSLDLKTMTLLLYQISKWGIFFCQPQQCHVHWFLLSLPLKKKKVMQNPREGGYPGVMMWTLVNTEPCLQTSPIASFGDNNNVQGPYDHSLTLRTQKVKSPS